MIKDNWNRLLVNKGKTIWWNDLYDLDRAGRASAVLTEKQAQQDEEPRVVHEVEPEKDPGFLKLLKDMEDRLSQQIVVEFGKMNDAIEANRKKLKSLRKRVKKLERVKANEEDKEKASEGDKEEDQNVDIDQVYERGMVVFVGDESGLVNVEVIEEDELEITSDDGEEEKEEAKNEAEKEAGKK